MATDQAPTEQNLRKLKAEEFIDIITQKDEERYANYYQKYEFWDKAIVLSNIELIENITLSGELTISLPVVILSGKFHSFYTYSNFENIFWIIDCDFQLGFNISGGTFQEELYIKGGKFQRTFSITDGNFQKGLSISAGTFPYFTLSGGTFHRDFTIFGGTFQQRFDIYGGTFHRDFTISGGTFNGKFSIRFCRVLSHFSFVGGTFLDAIRFDAGQIHTIHINSLTTKTNLSIGHDVLTDFLEFEEIIQKDSLIIIQANLLNLSFYNVQNFGTIFCNNINYRSYAFTHEDVQLPNKKGIVSVKPKLTISHSDLGKMTLTNCDLSGFGLNFVSSKITDVFVTGTLMPNKIISKDSKQRQLGYSQIKKIYEARGDRLEANRYFAKEMEAYQTTLSWRKWDDFWEKLNLNLNKFSTDYGQSWQRGLGTTLLVSALFYWGYCLCLGFWWARPTEPTISLFGKVASYFLEFLNPIHKADYVAQELLGEKAHISGWARTVEGISRIFIAYFVYQLIQAFRKHGKSSS